jgi:hypothetical protein
LSIVSSMCRTKYPIQQTKCKEILMWCWRMHADETLELWNLSMHLLSQIASSSTSKRRQSTYNVIHSIKRNKVTSRRVVNLDVVHSSLHLHHKKKHEYSHGQHCNGVSI